MKGVQHRTLTAAALVLASAGVWAAQGDVSGQQHGRQDMRSTNSAVELGNDEPRMTQQEIAQHRDRLQQMARSTIDRLTHENRNAMQLYRQAYGYAVFDTTKGALIVTGAGGTGVAQPKTGGQPTYMNMGSGGVGLGAGGENYRLVLLFQNQEAYRSFVNGEWNGDVAAQVAVGNAGAAAEQDFVHGVAMYRLGDTGLIAQIDISAIRFWPDARLNG
jgi:lipid-binding SYLF domain-containing protein